MTVRAGPPATTTQHVLSELRRAIVAGDYRPGQRVVQEDVAGRIGVSLAPVREALRALEQEGQVDYLPRRGYFITELHVEDLQQIYALREVLEAIAARATIPTLDHDGLARIELAARDCARAAGEGDVAAELDANRRFHFGMLDGPGQTHAMRLIQLLWDSTEAYRAMYYNSPEERRTTVDAHDDILAAVRRRDVEAAVSALSAHRDRALRVLTDLLSRP